MAIPDYQSLMLPVLKLAADGEEHKYRDAVETLAESHQLTEEELNTLLPSGSQAVFDNRVGWAKTYLKQAGLLDSKRRGYFHITDLGRELLRKGPSKIDVKLLKQYPEFRKFQRRKRSKTAKKKAPPETQTDTPDDLLASAYQELRTDLELRLLQQVKDLSPAFFERLVIDLLVKMGYGGSREDAGRAIGRSGDEGIDGIIDEDKLGLDVVYIQAKKWENTVGRPEIQKFAGALQGQRARKGVFLTTSTFSREARDYASIIDSRIVLIDGERLTRLMVDYNVGVSTVGIYEVKRIDTDYFTDE